MTLKQRELLSRYAQTQQYSLRTLPPGPEFREEKESFWQRLIRKLKRKS